jgi:catechol 2,3-dioxygenase-like lactoylglutathione lyase family enzyme
MLSEAAVIVVCQTRNSERAKSFYRDVLGLKFRGEDPFALSFSTGLIVLRVQKAFQEIPPSPFTRFGWVVPDITTAVQELSQKGVVFERQRGVPQDELGIWTVPDGARVAWFKDPDGNVLSLTQYPPGQA